PYPHNRYRIWSVSTDQHQENNAHDDAAMRGEKTDKPPIAEPKAQIRREHGLQGATHSTEVCDLEPPLATRPHCHDHNRHAPIAHVNRQHLPPIPDAEHSDVN